MEVAKYLKNIVDNLPETPGCYQYLNDEKKIIYVGKAKNLKRRVSSYFHKEDQPIKTRILVKNIRDIRYIVVDTDEDALLLENNLIKKYKPRYNVLLKDDKTYPSICITNEFFPRIFKTRKIIKNGSTYFGPYTHLGSMYYVLDIIKKIYNVRSCRLPLTPDAIKKKKFKVCLEYHIGNCKGPCVGNVSNEEYIKDIEEIKQILRGNTRELVQTLREEMENYAERLEFEKAEIVKRHYQLLESYRSKSQVVSNLINNIDVFSIESEEKMAFINYLHISNGSINQAFTFEYKKKLDETDEDLLSLGIVEMRERYKSNSKEIIVPFDLEMNLNGVTYTIPKTGEKKQLLKLSEMNVKQYKLDRLKQAEKLNPAQKTMRLLKEIQTDLKLEHPPVRIECFDNSNISGTDAVAGCVVFVEGKPAKKEYRKYNIKTVEGPDDYASMQEVVRRRYSRLKEENGTMPNLIITDGGKGQMEVVREVVEDELQLNIPIAGLAKDNRHRTNELLYGFPPVVIGMKQESALFHLLTRIQDEVHRFAIAFHRNKRSKRQIASILDDINGIGAATKTKLLNEFKSVNGIKSAKTEEIEKIIGKSKAKIVIEGLNK
jgi:excinuclease ABC subunit C